MTEEYIQKLKREVDAAAENREVFNSDTKQTLSSHVIDYLHARGLILQEGNVSVPIVPNMDIFYAMDVEINGEEPEMVFQRAWAAMIAAAQKKED